MQISNPDHTSLMFYGFTCTPKQMESIDYMQLPRFSIQIANLYQEGIKLSNLRRTLVSCSMLPNSELRIKSMQICSYMMMTFEGILNWASVLFVTAQCTQSHSAFFPPTARAIQEILEEFNALKSICSLQYSSTGEVHIDHKQSVDTAQTH